MLSIAPPELVAPPVAELTMKKDPAIESWPEFMIPPPSPPEAELAKIPTLTSDSNPAFSIPPPSGAIPPVTAKPLIATTAPFATVKMRNAGVPEAPLTLHSEVGLCLDESSGCWSGDHDMSREDRQRRSSKRSFPSPRART